MKRVTIAILAFLFLTFPLPSFAQEQVFTSSAKVEYTLPYPGLLPDSPFYILRTTRDRIVSFLISDPLKKAEFDLLQADKRLAAGIYLANKNKYTLANVTISKGENYFESALTKAAEAKGRGVAVDSVASSLYHSSLKHQEVIKGMEQKTKGELRAKFSAELKRAKEFEKKAKLIISQK